MKRMRWLAVAAAAGVLVAGCGGGGGSNSPSGAGTKKSALAYSHCMRAHGVSDFPDPNANGQIQLEAGPGSDLSPDSPVFTKAQQACKSLESAMAASPSQQRKDYAQALKF